MDETVKGYRGSRNGRGDRRVEVLEVSGGTREEPMLSGGIAVVPDDEEISGSVRDLEHPSGANYDWPGTPGAEGSERLAEALLRDASETGPDRDRYRTLAEEFAAEWVGELPAWSGPFVEEGALVLGSDGWDLLGSLWGTGRRRSWGDAGPAPGRGSAGSLKATLPARTDPEEVRRVLTERYFEDWHLPASRVRGWAEDRAAVHAEAREVIEGGEGLFLVDLYGPLARRIREVADAAGRSSDVVPLGAWADRAALNVLERPPWLAVEDLAAAIAGAVATVHGWPDPNAPDDDGMDEEDREEALAHALLGDALLTLCVANDELSRRSDPAARYTFFDARRLAEPSPPNVRFFSDLFPLLGDGRGFSGEELAVSWERWRRLPREERGTRARPVLGFLAELEQEGWARAFASPRPAGRHVRPDDALLGAPGSDKIVLVDLSGSTKPGRAAEIVGAVLLRLFAQRFGAGAPGPAKAFVNGRHAHASPPSRFRSALWAAAFEAQWSGMDVRPC